MDEHDLLQRAQQGDRGAFRQLVEAHKLQVFTLALGLTRNHHDAEDLVQEVFLKAYTALPRFRGDAQLSTWLYRVTVNAGRDARRRRTARRDDLTTPLEEHELTLVAGDPAADPERMAEARRIRSDVDHGVKRLSDAERAVWILRHDAHLSLREIAETTGRAEGTVKNLLFRAVRKLRRHLDHYLEPTKGGTAP